MVSPHQADAGRSQHLVPAPGHQVRAESGNVNGHMRNGLTGIDYPQGTDLVGSGHDFCHWVDSAEDVRLVNHRHHFGALIDKG